MLTANELEQRIGDRVDDAELGVAEGTIAAACTIAAQMNGDDIRDFTPDGWREGVSSMMVGGWSALNVDQVLGILEEAVGCLREEMAAE